MPERFRSTKGQRGFTLAEIIVTTAIFAIIMIAALAVYDRSNRVFSSSTEAAGLQQSTRIGFDKLVSDMRMAGFDYSRGGIPNGGGQFPQPDEQIEYAGTNAVVFRGNFDYNTNAANGNGLATGYSANNLSGLPIFPYVTTDNTEIVAYVLRSTAPNAANTDSISFYVDADVPRRAYPNVAGVTNGGHAENQVTISGIDTSNDHPPYTLYRVTVDDIRNNRTGTPVAENIRSLNFSYYTDGIGSALLTNADGTPVTQTRNAGGGTIATANSGAIGGDGQYDPNAANSTGAGTFADRTQRALIQSVRVSLVGMNATPAANYQNPTETNASFKNYREYSLSSLVVPRNLGLQGFPEPSFDPPGAPTITGMCIGHCAAPFITWTPPATGGPVTVGYEIQWDLSLNGSFSAPNTMPINDPSATSAILRDSGLDPSQLTYYRIVAINDNGPSLIPSNVWSVAPKNTTKPNAPAPPPSPTLPATLDQNNAITLTWVAPSTNATTAMQCTGTGGTTSGTNIPSQEQIRFQVARGTTPNFQPTSADLVLDTDTASQPANTIPGAVVSWVDAASANGQPVQSISPPAACVQYYYRVRALDRCSKTAAMNASGSTADSISDWYPALNTSAFPGMAVSTSTPSTPSAMVLDPDPTKTVCPPLANGVYCKIALNWNKVTTDTGNAPVAVDTYTLFRERRLQGTTTWAADTTLGAGGQTDISGFSSTPGSLAAYTDTTATYQDPVNGVYEYRYSVAAKICGTPSPNFSTPVIYPGCGFTVDITAQGASGAGTGTSGNPWVLGYNDTITATRTSGNLASVNFQVKLNGVDIPGATASFTTAPYIFGWTDQPGGVIYEVWITMVDMNGCPLTYVRYVSQQAQAPCTFQDLGTTPGRPVAPPNPALSSSGQQPRDVTFDFVYSAVPANNYAITNDQPQGGPFEAMHFIRSASDPGGAFTGDVTITWADVNGLHPELKFVSVDWVRIDNATGSALTTTNVPIAAANQALTFTTLTSLIDATQTSIPVTSTSAFGATGAKGTVYIDSEAMTYTVASATSLTVTRAALGTAGAQHASAAEVEKVMTTTIAAPSTQAGLANWPDIASGQSLRLVLHMTYDSSHKNSKLTTSGSILRDICVTYKVDSDPVRPQHCNLVGKLSTNSVNPATCD